MVEEASEGEEQEDKPLVSGDCARLVEHRTAWLSPLNLLCYRNQLLLVHLSLSNQHAPSLPLSASVPTWQQLVDSSPPPRQQQLNQEAALLVGVKILWTS